MISANSKIKKNVKNSLIQSLRAGLVPSIGLEYIQVGRQKEIEAISNDIKSIAEGGNAFRLVIGDYGSGKTFFLNIVQSIARQNNLVTVYAELNPNLRIYSTDGKSKRLYSEFMKNISTKNSRNNLRAVTEKFINEILILKDQSNDEKQLDSLIREKLKGITELACGYDFASVLYNYWEGYYKNNEELKDAAEKWLRAEYNRKTDARATLNVSSIIDDGSYYDHLKIMSRFVRLTGYAGLMVVIDEASNLYRVNNSTSRNKNYEQIRYMIDDILQGYGVEGMGFIMSGTPEFLENKNRGLYSDEALRSRLLENRFSNNDFVDNSGIVLRLSNLTKNDVLLLLKKLRNVFYEGDETKYNKCMPDNAINMFINYCYSKIGEDYYRTPRNTIKEFLDLMAILEQNPDANWYNLINQIEIKPDKEKDSMDFIDDDMSGNIELNNDLSKFKL